MHGILLLLSLAPSGAAVLWASPPAHRTNRLSAIRFWAFDLSCGAGSLSSPVREEHYKNASEVIILGEKYGSMLASGMPRWLLLSILGIVSRELTSRDVRERLVPALYESAEAQGKARSAADLLRRSLDLRVSSFLKGVTIRRPGDTRSIVDRFLAHEKEEFGKSMSSVEAVIEHELMGALTEVLQLEVADRLERTFSAAVQLNVSTSYNEIAELLTAADKNQDGNLSLDEVYELVFGSTLEPSLNEMAQKMVILRNPVTTESRVERWTSLALAPWVGRLGRASQFMREMSLWFETSGVKYSAVMSRKLARAISPERMPLSEAFAQVLNMTPPSKRTTAFPSVTEQEALSPLSEATGTASALQGGDLLSKSKASVESVLQALAVVQDKRANTELFRSSPDADEVEIEESVVVAKDAETSSSKQKRRWRIVLGLWRRRRQRDKATALQFPRIRRITQAWAQLTLLASAQSMPESLHRPDIQKA